MTTMEERRTMNRILLALALVWLSSVALAQETESTETTEATEEVNEYVNQLKSEEDGATQAPSGKAEPTENWFGCKPDEEEQLEPCEEIGAGS
jgi:hypothetical protein